MAVIRKYIEGDVLQASITQPNTFEVMSRDIALGVEQAIREVESGQGGDVEVINNIRLLPFMRNGVLYREQRGTTLKKEVELVAPFVAEMGHPFERDKVWKVAVPNIIIYYFNPGSSVVFSFYDSENNCIITMPIPFTNVFSGTATYTFGEGADRDKLHIQANSLCLGDRLRSKIHRNINVDSAYRLPQVLAEIFRSTPNNDLSLQSFLSYERLFQYLESIKHTIEDIDEFKARFKEIVLREHSDLERYISGENSDNRYGMLRTYCYTMITLHALTELLPLEQVSRIFIECFTIERFTSVRRLIYTITEMVEAL